jgi:endonuclease-3
MAAPARKKKSTKTSAGRGNAPAIQRVNDDAVRRQLRRLRAAYPNADCALDHDNPWQLLIATILSAQCTDKAVNKATPGLFAAFPDPEALGEAEQEQVEAVIKSIGLFRNKAKNIRGASRIIHERHNDRVPTAMKDLLELPGVARKTANVVLGVAFGIAEGVVVDTHVLRISNRLGWVDADTPIKVERALVERIPKQRWIRISHELILLGREICVARRPRCEQCKLAPDCPSAEVG